MKKYISTALILTILMTSVAIGVSTYISKSTNVAQTVKHKNPSSSDEAPYQEMRGLWVSFISLDMQNTDMTFESFKEKFDMIVTTALKARCNTLIVHVRPFSDALYTSEIYPPSHVLSGVQGVSPSYDALEYMCTAAHNASLKIHAWINPYRVATASIPDRLSKDNPYVKDNMLGFETESGVYLDPAKKGARQLVVDGVEEIIENYEVDGIHFDDYFYPPDCGDFDAMEFNAYQKSVKNITKAMHLSQWRENNVNMLLAEVYQKIKSINPNIEFGVSPQGNIENDYLISADVKSWCEVEGYVDYICPQMYYSVDHPVVRFEDSLKEWNNYSRHRKLKVYVGLGVYKAGTDADSGTWLNKSDVLSTQLHLLRKYNYDGYMLYDYNALVSENAQQELEVFKSVI